MKKYTKMLMVLLMVLAFGIASTDVMAKRSGGGRSRSTTRSAPKKAAPAKKNWGNKKDKSKAAIAPAKKKAWGNKKASSLKTSRSTKPIKRSAAQQKSFETAKKNGTAFKSKDAAMKSFKSKNKTTYRSTYSTRPSTRPSHIPQSYSHGGVSYNVNYNVGRGGYGYTNSLGAWIMYDAFTDAIMYNRLMRQNHYHYDPVVAQPVHARRTVVVRERSYAGLIATVAIIAIIVTGFVIVNKKKNN